MSCHAMPDQDRKPYLAAYPPGKGSLAHHVLHGAGGEHHGLGHHRGGKLEAIERAVALSHAQGVEGDYDVALPGQVAGTAVGIALVTRNEEIPVTTSVGATVHQRQQGV